MNSINTNIVNISFNLIRFPDGTVQWLDLRKKPVRSVPMDGEKHNET
jgi:hypothetical protein